MKINEDFIENYNTDIDERYFLEVDVEYPKELHELYNDLPILPETMRTEEV